MGDLMTWNTALSCPGCGAGIGSGGELAASPSVPPPGAVLVCRRCCELYLYDGGWRKPATVERALLLTDPQVVEALSRHQELALWEDSDRGRMIERMMPSLRALAAGGATVDLACSMAVDALLDAGFHTHPESVNLRGVGGA